MTREFLEGRRARYISPLRLYLMASLVYFLVAAAVPRQVSKTTVSVAGIDIGTVDGRTHAADRVGADTRQAVTSQQGLTGAARDSALSDIAKAPPISRAGVGGPHEVPAHPARQQACMGALYVFASGIALLGAIYWVALFD